MVITKVKNYTSTGLRYVENFKSKLQFLMAIIINSGYLRRILTNHHLMSNLLSPFPIVFQTCKVPIFSKHPDSLPRQQVCLSPLPRSDIRKGHGCFQFSSLPLVLFCGRALFSQACKWIFHHVQQAGR